MQKDKLISLISNPDLINIEDNLLLEDITQQYPYFSISHILLAKGLLNTQSLRHNQKLKKAALYSLDRKQLFKLITQKSGEEAFESFKSNATNKYPNIVKIEIATETILEK